MDGRCNKAASDLVQSRVFVIYYGVRHIANPRIVDGSVAGHDKVIVLPNRLSQVVKLCSAHVR